MIPRFETDFKTIWQRVESINPIAYGKTRNYTDGAVTYLSPYISRGVISTGQVLASLINRGFQLSEIESFVKELAWRDYFQRVWQEKEINQDIRQPQEKVIHHQTPTALLNGNTGIAGIDLAIQKLYETGYMHNHCRMYVAALACNIGESHWKNPAQWMYFHLLDGDWASNACSWQWVAGTNSSKKYYANQENISRFTKTPLENNYLNQDYDKLMTMEIPESLSETSIFRSKTIIPEPVKIHVDPQLPTLIYNYYNLDPMWHSDKKANRILLIEPAFFQEYPISQNCFDFMMKLSHNIPNIQVFTGNFMELQNLVLPGKIYFKEHPLNKHYRGEEESRNWLIPEVKGYFPSFFSYWKVLEKRLRATFQLAD